MSDEPWNKNTAPATSADFDRAYRAPITVWGDIRIPNEIKRLARQMRRAALWNWAVESGDFRAMSRDTGCATGVDFSHVAIAKAQMRVAQDDVRPQFLMGDVTRLDGAGRAVRCFLRRRLLPLSRPAGPAGLRIGGVPSSQTRSHTLDLGVGFDPERSFTLALGHDRDLHTCLALKNAQKSRRRLARSHWYWFVRA